MKKVFISVLLIGLMSCQNDIRPEVDQNTNQNPPPNNNGPGGTGEFANCIPLLSNTSFDIMTWNIENFPRKDETTISNLTEIFTELSPDIVAIQEIDDSQKFTELVDNLPGWAGIQSGGSLGIGFIYKKSEVSISSPTYPLNDASAFPRPPMIITATHTSGLQITLINLHLKCCDDGNSIDRRRSASTQLKSYIDANLVNSNVVMLGDYNEDITQPEGNGVLENFVNDSDDYKFADMPIATGGATYWSYPGWPSHLDHMLITKGLFEKVKDIRVLRFNECLSTYYDVISDHRPVLMQLK